MPRGKTWKGHDYEQRQDVELPRGEWRERIERAARTERAGGDLLLFAVRDGGHRIIAEVYDRE